MDVPRLLSIVLHAKSSTDRKKKMQNIMKKMHPQ
jgi:hypothetical protein